MEQHIFLPNPLETKGSLFLRSNHMQYHEDVKNSTWLVFFKQNLNEYILVPPKLNVKMIILCHFGNLVVEISLRIKIIQPLNNFS